MDGRLIKTSDKIQDSYTPNWAGGTKTIAVKRDSTVEIVVRDTDIENDDVMETFEVGADQLEKAARHQSARLHNCIPTHRFR